MSERISAQIPSKTLAFPSGFDVSWAASSPFGEGFCLGSENGYLQFFDKDLLPIGTPLKISRSGEAINSVVRVGEWLVASTRQEISFIGKERKVDQVQQFDLPLGAHQLSVTPSGHFVAALGRLGVLFANGEIANTDFTFLQSDGGKGLYVYRLLALPASNGHDLIVCAGRLAGIAQGVWHPSQNETAMQIMGVPGLDIIDICGMGTSQNPFAAVALARDATLTLSSDIATDKTPGLLKSSVVTGTGYRTVICRDHIFVLTSTGLFGFWELAKGYRTKSAIEPDELAILTLPMTAIDVNVVSDRYVVLVKLDEIEIIDVDSIQRPAEKQPIRIWKPIWETHGISHSVTELPLTA